MLKQIRIQNYKSLKDVTLNLEDVNLFIGPNNSGKSNVLKALEFFSDILFGENDYDLGNISYRKMSSPLNPTSITFKFADIDRDWIYKLELFDYDLFSKCFIETAFYTKKNALNISHLNLLNKNSWESSIVEGVYHSNYSPFKVLFNDITKDTFKQENITFIKNINASKFVQLNYEIGFDGLLKHFSFNNNEFESFFENIIIYKPDIGMIQHPLKNKENLQVEYLEEDCFNLAEFTFDFSQNHKKDYNSFIADFKSCVKEFEDVSTPYDPNDKTKTSLKLKFFDNNGIGYWIDEVSDGVIYFLALLAIVHQPNPPKLLLLEEPETGIHPRRINEIVDYIFKLAEEKGIQIILTTHSPKLLDKFNSMPQNVFVFDKENGETKIKNLKSDIIDVNNKKLIDAGLEEINYTSSLGEHWFDGFIGGLPDETN